ncbi:MAG: M3 family oligoendopeptidase, partial [Pedobacter sp.]
MIDLTIPKKKRIYIPQNLEMKWDNLEPILNELTLRSIENVQELEQWLKDKSELEAALEEDFAWRYIRMSCDTGNEELVKDFQY